ncbi:hypothetical protein BMW22_05780 [Rhizobium leguminosarum]|uniref:Uncharacterized protein n=1 Tax=Rhizobium leguminosarum TaxID=384 RepID=A0A1L3Z6A9_RHILE|nr:hypothetical protein [Rhizobium leguminosarum]API51206.1 hypothetical protein BMW22_05780 [Rhizobium leguminosarum]
MADGMELICIVGAGCETTHDRIDIVVEELGSEVVTTKHDGEPFDEVMAFANFGNREVNSYPHCVSIRRLNAYQISA